jgi:hypothetical protein
MRAAKWLIKIRNPNIEIPAFAEAASRRQAKQIQNSNFKISNQFLLFSSFPF